MISLRIKTDALDELAAKAQQLGRETDVAMFGARAAGNLVRNHLISLDAERPNALGGTRTHFYAAAAKSVHEPVPVGKGAAFIITQIGLAQRWLGGVIRAGQGESSYSGKATQYLAITARAEAYGLPPKNFDDLQFVPLKGGRAMLVQALQTKLKFGRKNKAGVRKVSGTTVGGLVMFWLVKEVDQKPDPTVMPEQEQIAEAARAEMDDYLSHTLMSN